MRIKPALRFYSESHAVTHKVERHFRARGVELPAGWETVVGALCFPSMVTDWQAETVAAFKSCLEQSPSHTFEFISFARRCLARYRRPGLDACARVEAFLLKYQWLVKEDGKLRVPKLSDADSKNPVKLVHVHQLQDGELARLLFPPKVTTAVQTVKVARQSISLRIRDSKAYFVPKGKS